MSQTEEYQSPFYPDFSKMQLEGKLTFEAVKNTVEHFKRMQQLTVPSIVVQENTMMRGCLDKDGKQIENISFPSNDMYNRTSIQVAYMFKFLMNIDTNETFEKRLDTAIQYEKQSGRKYVDFLHNEAQARIDLVYSKLISNG